MLNEDSARNRTIKAALKLAEENSWSEISLGAIAEESSVPLSDIFQEFQSRKDILKAFSILVNATVLQTLEQETSEADETPKDRLFDTLMTRFEVMEPYKKALSRIYADMKKGKNLDSVSVSHLLTTSHWLLEAAGVKTSGKRGALKVAGLSALQVRMLPVWFEDRDPGLAKTMSELDKKLKEGEEWLNKTDKYIERGKAFFCRFKRQNTDTSKQNDNHTENAAQSPEEKLASDKPMTDNGEPA